MQILISICHSSFQKKFASAILTETASRLKASTRLELFLPLSCVYFSDIKINDKILKENRVLVNFGEITFPSTFRRHLGSINPTVLWEFVEYSHGTLQTVLFLAP